jgi:hypothetical protein
MIMEMEYHFWGDMELKTDLSASVMDKNHLNLMSFGYTSHCLE